MKLPFRLTLKGSGSVKPRRSSNRGAGKAAPVVPCHGPAKRARAIQHQPPPSSAARAGPSRFQRFARISPRDSFLAFAKTCAKLAASFWDYLGSRLAIPAAAIIPPLRELILASARHPEPPSG